MKNLVKRSVEISHQLMYFRLSITLLNNVAWFFFTILIYNQVGLQAVFINHLLVFVGIFIGFIFSSFFYKLLGYLNTYRISLLMYLSAALITFLFFDNVAVIYPFVSLIRGIGVGIFSMVEIELMETEFVSKARNRLVSNIHGYGTIILF